MKFDLVKSPGTLRPMMFLALPVLAEETLNLLVGYTDWWLVGHFLDGPAYKSAMGLMAYAMWLLPSMFAAAAIGATALVSRHVGAGNRRQACRVTNQALVTGVFMALLATAAVLLWSDEFVRLLQLPEDAHPHAVMYLMIVAPVIPAIMIEQVAAACLRGAGDTVSGLVAKAIVNLVNVIVSASLVIGWGPLPQLGFQGLAIGTACGHGIGGLILLAILIKGRAGLKLRWRWLWPDFNIIRRLFRIGLPGGLDVAAVLICHLMYFSIINRLGTLSSAAHGLGVQIEAMAYLPGAAFQVAAATMAGQFLGAGQPRRAVHSVLLAGAVGGAIMSTAGAAFFFAGGPLTTFFTGSSSDAAGTLTTGLLRITAVSMPPLAVLMILTGALRGAGDTRWPLMTTLIGFFCLRLPGAMLLAWDSISLPLLGIEITGFGLGVAGAWYAMVADTYLRAALISLRFWHGGWKRKNV